MLQYAAISPFSGGQGPAWSRFCFASCALQKSALIARSCSSWSSLSTCVLQRNWIHAVAPNGQQDRTQSNPVRQHKGSWAWASWASESYQKQQGHQHHHHHHHHLLLLHHLRHLHLQHHDTLAKISSVLPHYSICSWPWQPQRCVFSRHHHHANGVWIWTSCRCLVFRRGLALASGRLKEPLFYKSIHIHWKHLET